MYERAAAIGAALKIESEPGKGTQLTVIWRLLRKGVCMSEFETHSGHVGRRHAVVRSGLSAFLKVFDDLELVGEAKGEKKRSACAREFTPTWF